MMQMAGLGPSPNTCSSFDKPIPEPDHMDIAGERTGAAVKTQGWLKSPVVWKAQSTRAMQAAHLELPFSLLLLCSQLLQRVLQGLRLAGVELPFLLQGP